MKLYIPFEAKSAATIIALVFHRYSEALRNRQCEQAFINSTSIMFLIDENIQVQSTWLTLANSKQQIGFLCFNKWHIVALVPM